eukprot:254388-Chlamydomonas_euryale.AAC.3
MEVGRGPCTLGGRGEGGCEHGVVQRTGHCQEGRDSTSSANAMTSHSMQPHVHAEETPPFRAHHASGVSPSVHLAAALARRHDGMDGWMDGWGRRLRLQSVRESGDGCRMLVCERVHGQMALPRDPPLGLPWHRLNLCAVRRLHASAGLH